MIKRAARNRLARCRYAGLSGRMKNAITLCCCLLFSQPSLLAINDSLITEARRHLNDQKYREAIGLLTPDDSQVNRLYLSQLQLLSQAYAGLNREKEAYQYTIRYQKLQNRLEREKRSAEEGRVANMFRHEEAAKQILQQQIVLQQYETESYRKSALLWALTILLLFLLAGLYFFAQGYLRRQRRGAQVWEQQQQEAGIKQLQAMINAEEKERGRIFERVQQHIISPLQLLESKIRQLYVASGANGKEHHFPEIADEIGTTRTEIEKIFAAAASGQPDHSDLIRNIGLVLYSVPDQYQVTFAHNVNSLLLEEEKNHHLVRIVQEWLQNILKHTAILPAYIELHCSAEKLELWLRNKMHRDVASALPGKGLGLANIQQRVVEMNGQISWTTDDEFRIQITIPLV